MSAMITIMPYYIWGTGQAQVNCICWNILFLAINLFWIVVIIRQRQPPRMTPDQSQLYEDVFSRSCSAREMLTLLSVARIETLKPGVKLVAKGSGSETLILIEQGHAKVITPGDNLIRLGHGDFVGEMSFLTGRPPVTDVVAENSVKIYRWLKSDLHELYETRVELRAALNEVIARDLTRKLTSENHVVPELSGTMVFRNR